MELGLQDDPGLGAFFNDEDVAHFTIQAVANAFVAGAADEVAFHKLVDYPLSKHGRKRRANGRCATCRTSTRATSRPAQVAGHQWRTGGQRVFRPGAH